jgi:hypothetical protein
MEITWGQCPHVPMENGGLQPSRSLVTLQKPGPDRVKS